MLQSRCFARHARRRRRCVGFRDRSDTILKPCSGRSRSMGIHMSSSTRKTVACIVGTRPEAIKMAPVIRAIRASSWARCRVIFTAQHRDLVAPIFEFFGIRPDVDLDVMRPGQSLTHLSNRLLSSLHDTLGREAPDFVLAQGDTTTVLASAL